MPLQRIIRHSITNCRNWGRISIKGWTHKWHPIPHLTAELWGVVCEYLWENWERYNGTALYRSSHGTVAVLLPCFAINWSQNQVTRQLQAITWFKCYFLHDTIVKKWKLRVEFYTLTLCSIYFVYVLVLKSQLIVQCIMGPMYDGLVQDCSISSRLAM